MGDTGAGMVWGVGIEDLRYVAQAKFIEMTSERLEPGLRCQQLPLDHIDYGASSLQ
jgi:hypothetical protein